MPTPCTYIDNNSTTPLHPEAFDAMLPWLRDRFGNPSSQHSLGREARSAVDEARASVADLIGATPGELVFTSGGTEADNAALRGVVERALDATPSVRPHVVVSAAEHEAVLSTLRSLVGQGRSNATYVPVDRFGMVSPQSVADALTDQTVLVSVMHSNNETGTIQPVGEIAAMCKERGVAVHTDAVQSAGKVPLDVAEMDVDILSLSAHKLYGPKGIGALYIRRGIDLVPHEMGGSQENGRRGGTENVSAIVGFGAAARAVERDMAEHVALTSSMRDALEHRIVAEVPSVAVNGHPDARLPGTLNVSFDGVEGQSVPIALDLARIAVSSGSACGSGAVRPSHVLLAMGVPDRLARAAVRFSFGRLNAPADVDRVMTALPAVVSRARESVRATGARL